MTQRRNRVTTTGSVPVKAAPEHAIGLFTPEGERRWVPGWVPSYPDPGTTETTEVGVVWQTERDGGSVTWIVIDSEATRMRYAFVYSDIAAGTVSVEAEPDGEHTLARVAYDVTALKSAGVDYIDALASGFDEQMRQWTSLLAEFTGAEQGRALP